MSYQKNKDYNVASGIDAAKIADGSVSNTEFQRLNGVTGDLQTQIDGKAASSHTHSSSDITQVSAATANYYPRKGAGSDLEFRSPAQVLSDIGAAASSHTHAATDITSGTLAHERGGLEADVSAVVKGDLLVGTGAGTIGLKTVGTDGHVLTADSTAAGGVKWAAASGGSSVHIQEFTSSGTWTKPSGCSVCIFIACGGGGGGGGGSRYGTGLAGSAGGGGGSLGVALYDASDLASTVTVTIGAGGAGGAARTTGTDVGPTNGSDGGDTYATSGGTRIVTGFGGGGTKTDGSGYYSLPKNPISALDSLVIGRNYNGGGDRTGVSRFDNDDLNYYTWSDALLGGRGGYTDSSSGHSQFGHLSLYAAGGGGNGGAAWTATDDRKGGNGGIGAYALNPSATAPAGGAVNTAGTSATAPTLPWVPGSGGGGGGSNHGGAGKNGGNGVRGGGGGGGGAAANGNNSGAGGSGGNGFMVVISW